MNTREEWLEKMVSKIRPVFSEAGYELPNNVKVSCGWTSRGARSKSANKTLGECWSPKCSSTDHHEIFLAPLDHESLSVGATLVHELAHVVVGVEEKHGRKFAKCAKAVGLTGKMKATVATPGLNETLKGFVAEAGEYPHGSLKALTNGKKKQGTRMLKVVCESCGYTVRTTAQWLEVGMPVCPCGETMVQG